MSVLFDFSAHLLGIFLGGLIFLFSLLLILFGIVLMASITADLIDDLKKRSERWKDS